MPIQPTISIVEARTDVIPPSVSAVTAAVQLQINRDFAPTWGVSATVRATQQPDPTDWVLSLVDQSDVGLGYHSIYYDDQGNLHIYGQVTASSRNPAWTITTSHEALEMLGDPYTNPPECVPVPGTNYGVWREVCDPVEDCAYDIDGISVSDFVFPSWFGLPSGPQTGYSFKRCASAPFDHSNGYVTTCNTDAKAAAAVGILSVEEKIMPPSIFRGRVPPLAIFLMSSTMREKASRWRGGVAGGGTLSELGYTLIRS